MKNEQILGLVNPLIALIFAITFFVFWWKYKDRSYILGIAFAYLMHGTGFLISHLAANVDGVIHVFGTNLLFSIGTISMVWAACYRKQLDISLGLLATIAGFSMAVLLWVQLYPIGFNARLLITNFSYGIMFAIGAVSLSRSISNGAIEKVLFGIFVVTAFQFWIRPIVTITLDANIDPSSYRESLYYSVLNATVALLALMLALSLIAACMADIMKDIQTRSENDLLTGLKNRRIFEEKAKAVFSNEEHTDLPMAMILADIDYFKKVNDNYGHQVGDRAIAAFGKLFREQIRDVDFAGRIGGEEFCAILWNSNTQTARLIAENIRLLFSQVEISDLPGNEFLTASFGVAESNPGDTYDDLFKRTDKALYQAKNKGRNQVCSATFDIKDTCLLEAVS